MPDFSKALLNLSIVSLSKSFATHCLWFLVKRANARAPIASAFVTALKTPPDAEQCAPTNLFDAKQK